MVVFVDFWIFIFEALVVQVDRCGCVLQADEPRNLNLTINLLYFRRIEQLSFCAGTHGKDLLDCKYSCRFLCLSGTNFNIMGCAVTHKA
jgi:hypothetical protein